MDRQSILWMYEWTNTWMNLWMNEWMKLTDEGMNDWIKEWMKDWKKNQCGNKNGEKRRDWSLYAFLQNTFTAVRYLLEIKMNIYLKAFKRLSKNKVSATKQNNFGQFVQIWQNFKDKVSNIIWEKHGFFCLFLRMKFFYMHYRIFSIYRPTKKQVKNVFLIHSILYFLYFK